MGELVNLRQARKLRDRMKKRLQSTENTAKFGRTRQQKNRDTHITDLLDRHLDQTKLECDD